MVDARLALGARRALLAGAALAFAWAGLIILTVDPGSSSPTTYGAALPAARVADVAAGLGLVVAGAIACTQPQVRRLGVLALLTGVAWFGADSDGWEAGPPLLRSVGALVAPFLIPLVLHIALTAPDGRLRSRSARATAVAAYGITAMISGARALVRDPLLELDCWRNCRDNTFLVHSDPGLARRLDDIWVWAALAMAIAVVVVAAHRLFRASGAARRLRVPVLAPAILVGAAEAAYAIALLSTALEDPERPGFAAVFLARALSYAALASGLTWLAMQVPRRRARVARVASELGEAPPPGTLREALRAALGDPGLEVLYPRTDSSGLIDADGRPAGGLSAGRAVARITRGDRPIAFVLHDPALVSESDLARALGSAARLSIENEALRALALGQVRELQESRARVVETGDAARRQLERNLHDGAQQRMLALSYDLRLARADAAEDRRSDAVAVLDRAVEETTAALEELRELAHGIHPAILTEAGLAPALATLADGAPVAVELQALPAARLPVNVETTAYVVVAEAIEDAARRDAAFVAATVQENGDRLVVVLDDDGLPRRTHLVHLADRVGAAGGSLDVGENTLRATIPCA